MQLLLVAALIFASVVAVFALQNAQTVPIRFFGWQRETSVAVIALGAAMVGALTAILAGVFRQVSMGLRARHLRAELDRIQRELEEERTAKSALVAQLEQAKEAALAKEQQKGTGEEGEEAPVEALESSEPVEAGEAVETEKRRSQDPSWPE